MSNEEDQNPVAPWRIEEATRQGLENTPIAAVACRNAELPFFVACALLQKESNGKNIFGNDKRTDSTGKVLEWGVFSGYKGPVTQQSYNLFYHEVVLHGRLSNGVGPTQITYAGPRRADGTRNGGLFADMEKRGLRPWMVYDNMRYGFELLAQYYRETGTWEQAGTRYNGSPSYGFDFARLVIFWDNLLHIRNQPA